MAKGQWIYAGLSYILFLILVIAFLNVLWEELSTDLYYYGNPNVFFYKLLFFGTMVICLSAIGLAWVGLHSSNQKLSFGSGVAFCMSMAGFIYVCYFTTHYDEIQYQSQPTKPDPFLRTGEIRKAEASFLAVKQGPPDTQPEYPGGFEKFLGYLKTNLRYPEDAKKAGIHGRVFLQFRVDTTGAIVDVKIAKGLHPSCDDEAIRLMEHSPKWIPALRSGKKITQQLLLPVKFGIDE